MTELTRAALAGALDRGITFLLRQQAATGTWTDFLLPAGQSDRWVTGYVGSVLAGLADPAARRAAGAAWGRLEQLAGAAGGWGYNAAVPGDADSTLWCLRLAHQLGHDDDAAARTASRFLETHLRDDGGLATYATVDHIRGYLGVPPERAFDGWLQAHVCVSAAGAHLPGYRARLRPYLTRHQEAAGHWRSYWWFADEYATCEAATALADTEHERVARAAAWARARVRRLCASEHAQPPAFALALALRILVRAPRFSPDDRDVTLGLQRLLDWQTATGAWPRSARLRVPRPDAIEPSGPDGAPGQPAWRLWRGLPPGPPTPELIWQYTFTTYSLDYTSVFTTATVLRALHELAQVIR